MRPLVFMANCHNPDDSEFLRQGDASGLAFLWNDSKSPHPGHNGSSHNLLYEPMAPAGTGRDLRAMQQIRDRGTKCSYSFERLFHGVLPPGHKAFIMEPADWQVQVFFDGACPLCRREINLIRRWDRKNRIWFTDIASADFRAEAWGIDQKTLMDSMHVRLRNGTWVSGVEAFRRMYGLIGFGWMIPLTRLPGISQLLDLAYRVFARNRLKWTGRCEVDGVCRIEPPVEEAKRIHDR